MIKITASLFLAIICIGCTNKNNNPDTAKAFFRHDWKSIETKDLPLQFGDIISFNINDTLVKAIILDFDKDEGGVWFGMCFLNENKLFGRQIPSGFNGDCVDLLDYAYLNQKALGDFEKITTENIDLNKIAVGSFSPVSNYKNLLRDYTWGLKQRTKKQTPCNKDVLGINSVRECYFDLDNFK